MNKLIVISLTLFTTFCVGFAIYFYLKTQALNQQLVLIHAAPNHVVNMSLMNQVSDTFYNNFGLWEAVLLIAATVLIITFNFVFRDKSITKS